jgi:tetratricopeptide (TPR) repeat protein
MGTIQRIYDWHWEAADTSYRRALDLEPGSAQALRIAGVQALTLGRWNEAIDLANKAIERDPLRPNSYNNLSLALLAVNRDTEAEAASRKALELDPDGAYGITGSGRPCSCRAKPMPPSRRCRRKRTRSGGSQDCHSYFTRSAGAASPTRRSPP